MLLSAQDGRSRFEGASGDLKPESELSRGPWNERNYTDDPQRREGIAHVRYGRDKSVTVGSAVRPGGPHADIWGARVWGEKLQSEAQRMRVSGRDCVALRGGYGHFPTGPTEGGSDGMSRCQRYSA